MRLVIFAAVGLLVGLGAGTAYKALEVKGVLVQAHADSVAAAAAAHADSLAAAQEAEALEETEEGHEEEQAAADSTRVEDASHEEATDAPADEEAATTDTEAEAAVEGGESTDPGDAPPLVGTDAEAQEGSGVPEAQAALAGESASGVTEEGARRLAKVFGAMKARDAARVLSELSDPEVEAILVMLGDRQAGQILSTFPAERAAALSRRVLGRTGGDQ